MTAERWVLFAMAMGCYFAIVVLFLTMWDWAKKHPNKTRWHR